MPLGLKKYCKWLNIRIRSLVDQPYSAQTRASVADSVFLVSYFNQGIGGSSLDFFPRATSPYFPLFLFSLPQLYGKKLGIIVDFVMVGT
jgi:hypothetical protein